MTGRQALAWLVAVCIFGVMDPVVAATSLTDAVSAALRGDPRVSAADARRRAAAYEVRVARGGYFPTVDVNGALGRERSNIKSLRLTGADDRYLTRRELGVSVNQMLFDGLFTRSEVERRRALLDAAGSGLEEAREQVAFLAIEAYLDVLRSRQLVRLAQDNIAFHEVTLSKVEQRSREGLGTDADRSQAAARLALARSVLSAREGALREAVTSYVRVVGENPHTLEDLDVASPSFLERGTAIDSAALRAAIDQAVREGVDSNPSLQSAQARVDAAAAELRGSRAAYMPRLDLQLNAHRDGDLSGIEGVRNSDNVLLVGRWNLFNGGSDVAREQALAQRQMAARDEAADARRALEERVGIAVQAKATSEERLQYLRGHVDSAERTLQAYEAQFRLGRRTLLDTLNAVNEVFTARSNLVSGRYEDILNQYFIEAGKGTLVDSLGVATGQ